jgi:hypothetical protein
VTRIVSETRERFIVAIAEQVPVERIAEVHFFNPIKQGGMESGVAVVALTPRAESEKHIVFTAHYRHTLKGLDRGKWQVTTVEEADAPLVTVETVVRGVQRRAGDLEAPERMDGDSVREVVAAAAARSAP